MNTLISVVVPTYNEQNVIADCLESLKEQTYKNMEIIIVDDGSSDETVTITKKNKVNVLTQKHQGPGVARNLGAKKAKGKILVFVDADMTFDKNFIKDLTKPIVLKKSIGTFSKNEIVKNQNDFWSICWNLNRNLPPNRMVPENYPDKSPVFRAILKSKFDAVDGFSITGEYTDDWSLSEKLGIKATLASGAIYFHTNPSALSEIYKQARWIGKNKFLTGNLLRKVKSLIVYSPVSSIAVGLVKSVIKLNPRFFIFKIVYNSAIFISVLKSFTGEKKHK